MSVVEEGTFNNLRVTSIKTEIKWEIALKLLTEFDSKTSLTKITKPEGGDVYIFFSTNEDDEKELIDAVMSEADKKIYKERKDAALKQDGAANPNA